MKKTVEIDLNQDFSQMTHLGFVRNVLIPILNAIEERTEMPNQDIEIKLNYDPNKLNTQMDPMQLNTFLNVLEDAKKSGITVKQENPEALIQPDLVADFSDSNLRQMKKEGMSQEDIKSYSTPEFKQSLFSRIKAFFSRKPKDSPNTINSDLPPIQAESPYASLPVLSQPTGGGDSIIYSSWPPPEKKEDITYSSWPPPEKKRGFHSLWYTTICAIF